MKGYLLSSLLALSIGLHSKGRMGHGLFATVRSITVQKVGSILVIVSGVLGVKSS
ncbi:hypothetical protein J2T20_001962 [Paenibacillus wynnii]|nr:hypothetical protein [Paenibacillus wynnii]